MKEHEGDAARSVSLAGLRTAHSASVVVEFALAAEALPAVSPSDHAPLVYVVDDDESFRDSLRWLLESAGYRVLTYSTAERFLHEYEPGAAACLVVDVRLPGMSGLELKRELKQVGETLLIIFMTGHADQRTALEALKNGASRLLQKPFKDAQLLDWIAQTVRDKYGDAALEHSRC